MSKLVSKNLGLAGFTAVKPRVHVPLWAREDYRARRGASQSIRDEVVLVQSVAENGYSSLALLDAEEAEYPEAFFFMNTVDETTRWAIENDCCAVQEPMPFGGWGEIRVTHESVNSGRSVGMLAAYGFVDVIRDILILAFEKTDALLIWGDVTSGYNTYEAPIGIAKNVDEALDFILSNNVDGWELL